MKIITDISTIGVEPDGGLNNALFQIYNENVFVFIERSTYELLSPEIIEEAESLDNIDLTPEEIINEKVMYCVMETLDQTMILETISLAEQFKQAEIKYVIIEG